MNAAAAPAATPPVNPHPNRPASRPAEPPPASQNPSLADAPEVEVQTLERMLASPSWPRRAIAAMRLERYGCAPSREKLTKLLRDRSWQVRSFALRSLARVGGESDAAWIDNEVDPRVLRAALRYRFHIEPSRLLRGVEALARSNDLKDKMLAAELGAAANDPDLKKVAIDAAKQIILRMNRTEAGGLSPRLAVLTGESGLHRPFQWQQWLMKTGRTFELRPGYAAADGAAAEPSRLAQLEPEQYVGLETYMAALSEHKVDLAICLDCTASMGREIAAAQGGIDDMMLFIGDVVSSLRVAFIAYRDRSDEFETKAWPFSNDIVQVRRQLWQLSADGGGDEPEAVYPAIRIAMTQLQWRGDCDRVLVIVGDAPPHVGYGTPCVEFARRAHDEAHLTTHTIEARGKAVKYFAEIAEAGGGRCVTLSDSDALIAEITGLTLGDRFEDEFREFFRVYLELCR